MHETMEEKGMRKKLVCTLLSGQTRIKKKTENIAKAF